MRLENTGNAVLDGSASPERSRSWLAVGTAGFLFALSITVAVRSASLGYWTPIGPGPGFFPLLLAIFLGAASIVWGLQQWRRSEPKPTSEGERGSEAGMKAITVTVASLVVLASLLETLGFQLSMLLFLFFHLRLVGRHKWWVTVGVMLLGSFGVFTLFNGFLGVSLPTSSIPFLSELGL